MASRVVAHRVLIQVCPCIVTKCLSVLRFKPSRIARQPQANTTRPNTEYAVVRCRVAGLLRGVVDKFASSDGHHGSSPPRHDRASQFQRAVVPESPSLDSHLRTSCIATVSRAVHLIEGKKREREHRAGQGHRPHDDIQRSANGSDAASVRDRSMHIHQRHANERPLVALETHENIFKTNFPPSDRKRAARANLSSCKF